MSDEISPSQQQAEVGLPPALDAAQTLEEAKRNFDIENQVRRFPHLV